MGDICFLQANVSPGIPQQVLRKEQATQVTGICHRMCFTRKISSHLAYSDLVRTEDSIPCLRRDPAAVSSGE